ncbi:MAG: MFS transporter [Acidobacteria bacterium]|nr:MFS transporter [Acidobacteriota bacterium]
MKPRSGLPRPVWLFGWVSFATDAASELIYPLLPFFLTQVLGAGAVALGLVEGAAEAANSLLKIASGRLSDRRGAKRRRLVLLGYGVSSAVRPLIALTTSWTQVFAVRLTDRVGKGIRGAPRDAMLAGWATETTRGKIYGFHRAMDHAGAVVGPILASLFLIFYPGEYRTLFALTIIPGAIAVALIFLIPEKEPVAAEEAPVASGNLVPLTCPAEATKWRRWKPRSGEGGSRTPEARSGDGGSETNDARLPRRFYGFMAVLALFMLGNSTDAFLLLKLTEAAGGVQYVPLMWSGLHVVKAAVSMVGGSWSDRVGRRTVIGIGWVVYAVVYVGFAISTTLPALLALFMFYGFYFGLTEGVQKALVADLAPVSRRGNAFGIYEAVSGVGALAASVIFGAIWTAYGAPAAFGTGAAIALVATALLFAVVPRRTAKT